jgi:hypothetical protein
MLNHTTEVANASRARTATVSKCVEVFFVIRILWVSSSHFRYSSRLAGRLSAVNKTSALQ